MTDLSWEEFGRVQLCVGTVLAVEPEREVPNGARLA